MKFALLLLAAFSAGAQVMPFPGPGLPVSGGGGGGTITLISHILGPAGGGTSSAIVSTGSTECFVWKSGAGSDGGAAPTDSKSNTYVLAFWDSSRTSLWYANASTGAFAVGSGHTFTGPGGEFNAWGAACFSNTLTNGNLDPGATAGSSSGITTVSPTAGAGPYDPGSGQHIIFVVLSSNTTSGTWSGVTPGFTILDQADFSGGVNYEGAFAYLVQASGTSITPTATFSTAGDLIGLTASFKGQ